MKGGRRKKRRAKNSNSSDGDVGSVTILHSANAPLPFRRVKKSCGTKSSRELEDEESDNEVDSFEACSSQKNGKALKKSNEEDIPEQNFVCYPFDLWDVLSRYIRPESIAKFASLCQSANAAVNRATFWLNLHDKYAESISRQEYRSKGRELLPVKLSKNYINYFFTGNLRCAVIKSLFFTYAPFKERLSKKQLHLDPHIVTGYICLCNWLTTRKNPKNFQVAFKLAAKLFKNSKPMNRVKDSWDDDDASMGCDADLGQSQDEFCKLLLFDCDHLSELPTSLSGLKILDFNVTSTGDGFRYQKVTMIFGPAHIRLEKDSNGRVTVMSPHSIAVTIDSITSINLLDWYHPKYNCS